MAKAHLTTKAGTKVTIEGSEAEIASLIAKIDGNQPVPPKESATATKRQKHKEVSRSSSRPTPVTLIAELIDGDFFKKPRELGAIKLALAEQGHFYPVTTLSPVMLRLVRKKEIRRIKEKKRWLYVN